VKVVGYAHEVTHEKSTLRVFLANNGEGLPRHEHDYSHLTMCHSGSCVIRKEGIEKIINKYTQPINLKANEWHEIEALEDGTVFVNVFSEGKY
jgi:quercetin dioxygenase-like cupin family protein